MSKLTPEMQDMLDKIYAEHHKKHKTTIGNYFQNKNKHFPFSQALMTAHEIRSNPSYKRRLIKMGYGKQVKKLLRCSGIFWFILFLIAIALSLD